MNGPDDDDMAEAVAERLATRRAEAVARQTARRERRAVLSRRRSAGLRRRHAAKLARVQRQDPRCEVCGSPMVLIEPGQTAHPMCDGQPE